MTTGEKISRLRKGQQLSQEEFAEILDISRQTVSKWENGTAQPTGENLRLVAEKFNIPVSALYSTENTEPAEEMPVKSEKYNRHLFAYAGFLIIIAAFAIMTLNLQKEVEELEDLVAGLYEQLSVINTRMDRLHSQRQPQTEQFTHYEYKVRNYDRETDMLTLDISIVPTDYSNTTKARLMATTEKGVFSADAVLEGHTFTAQLEVSRQEETPLYLYLYDGDKVRSYLVDYLPDLTADYRLDIKRVAVVGMDVAVTENGSLDLRNGRVDITFGYSINTANENQTAYPQLAVLEIYADGWLVDQRSIDRITDQDYYDLAAKQKNYTDGQHYYGNGYGHRSFNTAGMGGTTIIENEKIKEDSQITFRVILVDNHGERYEEYIE